MPSTVEPPVPRRASPGLILRPPAMGDEEPMRAAHAELSAEGFAFLFDPHRSWGEQLDVFDREARGVGLPAGRVPCDFLVAQVGPEIVGRVSIRHTLTPVLLAIGGHIGYAVRPAVRRRGHATAMLGLSVQRLAALGVQEVLVTCDDDNLASTRVIERCGGVLEDVQTVADGVPAKRRYWITSS